MINHYDSRCLTSLFHFYSYLSLLRISYYDFQLDKIDYDEYFLIPRCRYCELKRKGGLIGHQRLLLLILLVLDEESGFELKPYPSPSPNKK